MKTLLCTLLIIAVMVFGSSKSAVSGELANTYWYSPKMGFLYFVSDGTVKQCESGTLREGSWQGSYENLALRLVAGDGSIVTISGKVDKNDVMDATQISKRYGKSPFKMNSGPDPNGKPGQGFKWQYDNCLKKNKKQ